MSYNKPYANQVFHWFDTRIILCYVMLCFMFSLRIQHLRKLHHKLSTTVLRFTQILDMHRLISDVI